MKKVFLIHGWGGYPEEGWLPWLKKKLEARWFEVFVPAMPDAEHPQMGVWLKHLSRILGIPDQNYYLVGHSLGCMTIFRYLETLKKNQKIGGAVLVAGFTSNLGFEELNSFFKKPIAWEKIKSHCPRFTAVHSDNDPYVSVHYGEFFKEKLGAEVVIEHAKKHFSGDDGITELPSVLDAVLKLSTTRSKGWSG